MKKSKSNSHNLGEKETKEVNRQSQPSLPIAEKVEIPFPQSEKDSGRPLSAASSLTNESEIEQIVDAWIAGKVEGVPALETSGQPSIPAISEEARSKHPLTATLLEPVIRLPFDYIAIGTEYDAWELHDREAKDLTEVWLHVLQRLLPATQSVDIIIAATCTIGIIGMKYVRYRKDMKLAEKQAQSERSETKTDKLREFRGSLPAQIDKVVTH